MTATDSSCPRCKAYWITGEPSCQFCGFHPASKGSEPSRFDPAAPPSTDPTGAGPHGAAGGAPKGKRRSRAMVTAVVALVVAVGLAAGIAYAATRTVLADEHGNHALSPVCAGEGMADAAAYDADRGSSGLVELTRGADGWDGSDTTTVAEVDLVACRSRSAAPHRSIGCQARWTQSNHELKPDATATGEIVTYSTEFFRITLEFREARTGAIVATEHVTPPIECPADDGALMLDASTKRHRVIPDAEADAVVAAYADGKAPSDASAD